MVGDVCDDGVDKKAAGIRLLAALMDDFWGHDACSARRGVRHRPHQRAATESFLTEARQAIWSVNSNLPAGRRADTARSSTIESMARTSFTLVMLAIAGAMALMLGIVGIYGVIAYAVSQRTREIGIRMALGAHPAGLQQMFVRHGLLLAGIGAVIGLGRGRRADASDVVSAVRRQGSRSADLCRSRGDLDRGGRAGQLSSGAARYHGRSHRCAAGRIVATRRTSHLNVAAWLKEIVPPAEVVIKTRGGKCREDVILYIHASAASRQALQNIGGHSELPLFGGYPAPEARNQGRVGGYGRSSANDNVGARIAAGPGNQQSLGSVDGHGRALIGPVENGIRQSHRGREGTPRPLRPSP